MNNKKALKMIKQFYKSKGYQRLNLESALLTHHLWFDDTSFKEEQFILDGFHCYHYFDDTENFYIKDNTVILEKEKETIAYLLKYKELEKIKTQQLKNENPTEKAA